MLVSSPDNVESTLSEGQILCLFAVPSKGAPSRPCLEPESLHRCTEHRYTFKKVEGCEKQHHPFQRESVFNLLPYDTGVLK